MSGEPKGAPTSYEELAVLVENLGLVVRETRRARGLSGRAAAEQIGMDFSVLTRIERGAQFHTGPLPRLLRWLEASRG